MKLESYTHETGLAQITSETKKFQASALSPNTARAYASDWKSFEAWCSQMGLLSMPASPVSVANYLSDKAELIDERGEWLYAPATIARWVAAVNKAHMVANQMPPGKHPEVQTTLSGIKKLHARPQRRVSPLLLIDLRKALNAIDFNHFPDGVIGSRDAAILLMGFAGAFRRSELTSLFIEDITVHIEDGLHVRIVTSKTDQEGRGSIKALPYGANPITCAPCAFARWVKVIDAHDTSRPALLRTLREMDPNVHICKESLDALKRLDSKLPLFRVAAKGGILFQEALSGHAVNNIVKKRVDDIGFNSMRYGGHSLRAGFITQAFRAGASAHEIMRQTGHTNPATLEIYSREHDPLRSNAVTRIGL